MLATAPDGEIEDVAELLPTEKVIEDWEHIDTTTEKIVLQSHRLCTYLLDYLRSVMSGHYKENDGPDSEYLMVTCPRVIPFELLILDWAIKLLNKVGEAELFKKTTLEQDQAELEKVRREKPSDPALESVLMLNVQAKQVFLDHLKLLKIVKAIVERIQELPIGDEGAFSAATLQPV